MRHNMMTMPKIQLNSKIVNNMLPEWGRFVMTVKLNRGLKESNHVQLYAYLKQHELHANENKMLMERLNQHSHDPLDLVSNVSPYQYPSSSSVPSQSSYTLPLTYQPQFANNIHLDIGLSLADELLDNLTKQNGRVVVQNVQGRQNRVQGNNVRDTVAPGNRGAQNCNQPKRPQNSEYFKEKMLLMQAQENGVDLDEEKLLFLAGGQPNTFDDESHEEHEIHNDVQPNDVVDSDTEYTSNSNIISYEQYVQDNEDQVVHSDVSSVPNDAVMIITNDIYEQDAQCVTSNKPNNTVNASLTAELARYKELAEVYEKRAQFELTKRELMIDTQMRMIIKDRNVKEESLQKELHSVKMKLNSTLNHNKLIREEVSMLKQDFKQKENKLLEEFLDMKHLKEKVEDKLYKQDQSLQTVHMLCKPKSFYDEVNRVAIGYKNPFYLSKAKQIQHALYNGHEIVKTNHAHALVHDSEA
ncbi:hypothetical protein Tco_1325850, partial [Tanacetum coccineum]